MHTGIVRNNAGVNDRDNALVGAGGAGASPFRFQGTTLTDWLIAADPRSRAADEWIRYAQELLALGRHREAIRAWYHAILVGCWSNGLLHHRVGLTNWEYALALSAANSWRARFLDLTQRFDQAWYGGRVEIDESHAFALEAEQILAQLRAAKNPKSASAA